MVLAHTTILLHFIILNNSYHAQTSNTVLDHVIVVHFCAGFTFSFLKMWLFPYLYGFCNPVWIYRKKINDMIKSQNLLNLPSNNQTIIVLTQYYTWFISHVGYIKYNFIMKEHKILQTNYQDCGDVNYLNVLFL